MMLQHAVMQSCSHAVMQSCSHAVMQQVVTFLSGKANAFSVTLADEPVLSLTGFPVVTLPHIDNDATSTPGERKV